MIQQQFIPFTWLNHAAFNIGMRAYSFETVIERRRTCIHG